MAAQKYKGLSNKTAFDFGSDFAVERYASTSPDGSEQLWSGTTILGR
ncbi:MAG: hypothetical protein U0X58_03280 [Flavobacteriaceae bacterium]